MLLFLASARTTPRRTTFSSGSGRRDGSSFRAGSSLILLFEQSKRHVERTTAALWQAIPKGQMRTTLCAAFATIAAALRTTHRRALLLSPASLYPLAVRAEPLPSGRKELYALVCAAAWVLNRAAGGSLMTAMLPSY